MATGRNPEGFEIVNYGKSYDIGINKGKRRWQLASGGVRQNVGPGKDVVLQGRRVILNGEILMDGTTRIGTSVGDIQGISITTGAPGTTLVSDGTNYVDTNLSTTDLDTTGASVGNVISFDGSNWVATAGGGGGPIALNDLTDVTIASLEPNHILISDGATFSNAQLRTTDIYNVGVTPGDVIQFDGSNWVAATGGGGGALHLNELNDVTISGLEGKHILISDGTNFSNAQLRTTDIYNVGVTTGDVIQFDGSDWIAAAGGGGGALHLNELNDVTISGLEGEHVLVSDGTNFSNAQLRTTDIYNVGSTEGDVIAFNGSNWVSTAHINDATLHKSTDEQTTLDAFSPAGGVLTPDDINTYTSVTPAGIYDITSTVDGNVYTLERNAAAGGASRYIPSDSGLDLTLDGTTSVGFGYYLTPHPSLSYIYVGAGADLNIYNVTSSLPSTPTMQISGFGSACYHVDFNHDVTLAASTGKLVAGNGVQLLNVTGPETITADSRVYTASQPFFVLWGKNVGVNENILYVHQFTGVRVLDTTTMDAGGTNGLLQNFAIPNVASPTFPNMTFNTTNTKLFVVLPLTGVRSYDIDGVTGLLSNPQDYTGGLNTRTIEYIEPSTGNLYVAEETQITILDESLNVVGTVPKPTSADIQAFVQKGDDALVGYSVADTEITSWDLESKVNVTTPLNIQTSLTVDNLVAGTHRIFVYENSGGNNDDSGGMVVGFRDFGYNRSIIPREANSVYLIEWKWSWNLTTDMAMDYNIRGKITQSAADTFTEPTRYFNTGGFQGSGSSISYVYTSTSTDPIQIDIQGQRNGGTGNTGVDYMNITVTEYPAGTSIQSF